MMKQMRSPFLALLVLVGLFQNTISCIDNIQTLVILESEVSDLSVVRTYIFCPGSLLNVGKLDVDFNFVGFNMQPAVPLRPNMHLKCGDDGTRDGLCWFINGDVHLDATKILGVMDNDRVDNVLIEGFTFINSNKYSMWATKPGDITFRDCEWREHTASLSPILLDFFDGTNEQLSVTFENCLFTDNRYFGDGSNTALVYANSAQNSLTFRKTVFENNDMVFNNTLAATNSFLIETLGPLTVEQSCFRNNVLGVSNTVVFGNTFTTSEINLDNSFGSICGYAAVFETMKQFDDFAPSCRTTTTSSTCIALEIAPEPTASPTPAPTSEPSMSPTSAPTTTPSASPSRNPSGSPTTLMPTVAPTASVPATLATTTAPTEEVVPTKAPIQFEFPATDAPTVNVDATGAPVNIDGFQNRGAGSVGRSLCVAVIAVLCSSMMLWI